MATIEYWIQLENHPWDACPNNVDRMSGMDLKTITGKDKVSVTLNSPGTGVSKPRTMFAPLRDDKGNVIDALILRRYKPPQKADGSDAWTVPDDRKVNPWDLNEQDPTDNGTMGTIPGPVIECNVGDSVVVHFRNLDMRGTIVIVEKCFDFPPPIGRICFPVPTFQPLPIEDRVHSLHPHGFVFEPRSDGAYPLSPPDPDQPVSGGPPPGGEPPVPDESANWAGVPGFSGTLKQGDRVPPGGTFIYRWNTFGWPTTAGVWLYHDHSICDTENVALGSIGIIVIHNPNNTDEEVDIRAGDPNDPSKLDPAFLPGGSPNGSPIQITCFPFPPLPREFSFRVLPGDLVGLGMMEETLSSTLMGDTGGSEMAEPGKRKRAKATEAEEEIGPPVLARTLQRGNLLLELDEKLARFVRFCFFTYRTPPTKGLYLQLFHTLTGAPQTTMGASMLINGRTFLGNTPTIVTGTSTRMRFGVVGMGSDTHTFHIHGHRWIIPGPHGNTPGTIQGSVMDTPVSQFEDTRIFGPANSFVFTIPGQSGSFMRAGGPGATEAVGEWHMHCHVLQHMMTGMMGSLLIVNGGELAFQLPRGVPCPAEVPGGGDGGGGGPQTVTVHVQDFQFSPATVAIKVGDTVHWVWDGNNHSTTADGGAWDSGVHNSGFTFDHMFMSAGSFPYFCSIHGGPGGQGMHGSVTVS
jgi:plastocyanin/FtsP/CotA-like multicopper oxidase with cupredoxin domain